MSQEHTVFRKVWLILTEKEQMNNEDKKEQINPRLTRGAPWTSTRGSMATYQLSTASSCAAIQPMGHFLLERKRLTRQCSVRQPPRDFK